jgi:hypothetical protein
MPPIRIGMRVRGSNHQRLGRVVRLDGEGFVVAKGRLFPREFRVRPEDVIRVLDELVIVAQHRPELAEAAGLAPAHQRRRV